MNCTNVNQRYTNINKEVLFFFILYKSYSSQKQWSKAVNAFFLSTKFPKCLFIYLLFVIWYIFAFLTFQCKCNNVATINAAVLLIIQCIQNNSIILFRIQNSNLFIFELISRQMLYFAYFANSMWKNAII